MFNALKKMNLPNKLTMLRIVLVPLFIILLSIPSSVYETTTTSMDMYGKTQTTTTVSIAKAIVGWIALAVFVIASITDTLDGMISRKNGIVTKFGKIMDPLADKLLVSAGFIMLTGLGIVPAAITAVRNARNGMFSAGFLPGSRRLIPVSVHTDQLLCLPDPLIPSKGFS